MVRDCQHQSRRDKRRREPEQPQAPTGLAAADGGRAAGLASENGFGQMRPREPRGRNHQQQQQAISGKPTEALHTDAPSRLDRKRVRE